MYENIIRSILFALSKKDPEIAHTIARHAIGALQAVPGLMPLLESWSYGAEPSRPVVLAGIKFPNRVGLAAGLDKHAEMLPFMQAIGFGFVEVGTVLPLPQSGNPRPRLFRLPEDNALCNRMGFNSHGMEAVAKRLAEVSGRIHIPIGGSLGKQKDTPLDDAAQDYLKVLRRLAPYVAYYAANVSSPNTVGLRRLQGREYLEALIRQLVQAERSRARACNTLAKPVFVKLAPDLSYEELDVSLDAIEHGGAQGIILGNTTLHPPANFPTKRLQEINGGFSGPHLFARTVEMVRFTRQRTQLPIIACGGIVSPGRARQLRDVGANLFQILTGLIYQGPQLVRELRSAVA